VGWRGAFLCLRRLPAPTPTLVSLGDDRRPPRPRPQSSVRSVRRPALPVSGDAGRRDQQQTMASAGGVRPSDGGVGVPRLARHPAGLSRVGASGGMRRLIRFCARAPIGCQGDGVSVRVGDGRWRRAGRRRTVRGGCAVAAGSSSSLYRSFSRGGFSYRLRNQDVGRQDLVVHYVALAFARADLLPPLLAAWTANIVFFGIGTSLFVRART